MSYLQLVSVDLSTTGLPGECLSFAESAVGAPHLYANATVAWNNTEFKHPDQDFPEGVDVPIWFSFWTSIDGVFADYGHVCYRLRDGRIFSSPYRQGTGQVFLGSIQELQQKYTDGHPLVYRGWTEDIALIKIVKEEEPMPNDGDIDNVYLQSNGRVATDAEKATYRTKSWSAPDGLYYGKVRVDFENTQKALKDAQNASYEPAPQLFIKKG